MGYAVLKSDFEEIDKRVQKLKDVAREEHERLLAEVARLRGDVLRFAKRKLQEQSRS